MNNIPTQTHAILHGKCPHCRKGDLFTHSAYNLKYFLLMNRYCPHCGQDMEPESGFYWGAMYINYAFVTGFFIAFLVFFYIMGLESFKAVLIVGSIYMSTVLILTPIMVRHSRVLMLHFFGSIKFSESAYLNGKTNSATV